MRNADFIQELHCELIKLGCPRRHVRRLVQEFADHREDLQHAALSEGVSNEEATTRASAQLGNPHLLAEQLMDSLRRSTWCGRHSLIAFSLLPVLGFPVLWLFILFAQCAVEYTVVFGCDDQRIHNSVSNPAGFHRILLGFHCMDYVAIALATLVFFWLARWSAVKLKWLIIASAICSLCALITWGRLTPHSFAIGFTVNSSLNLQWFRAAVPLVVAAIAYALHWRTTRVPAAY